MSIPRIKGSEIIVLFFFSSPFFKGISFSPIKTSILWKDFTSSMNFKEHLTLLKQLLRILNFL